MKILAVISLIGAMLVPTAFGQQTNIWRDQWQIAKYGHTLTNANTVQSADRVAINSRPAIRLHNRALERSSASPIPWREQWFKAKYGRYSPLWESQHNAGKENDRSVEQTAAESKTQNSFTPTRNAWRDQIMKMKYGR
jgi:hypothetical protein